MEDIHQTHDYTKLHCDSCMDKVLLSHGWSEPSPSESMHHDIVPIFPDCVSCMQQLVGPTEHSDLVAPYPFCYPNLEEIFSCNG